MTPLAKRLPRELRGNIGRYLGMFLLMSVSIALVAGFLLAASSIVGASGSYDERFKIESGRFETSFSASDEALDAVEGLGVEVTPLLNVLAPLEGADEVGIRTGSTVRAYAVREKVDLAAYVEGSRPDSDDEIALDRVFSEHNGVSVGDGVLVAGRRFVVSGIMTLPDYQALFEKNTDFVFNALTFTVAEVTPSALAELMAQGSEGTRASYTYAFVVGDSKMSLPDRLDLEVDISAALADNGSIPVDMIDREMNQGIGYAVEDATHDQVMWEVLLLVIVVIMAFVFVVLTGSTIEEESAVIGTLMASGYRRREIVLHYMAMPFFVGLAASVVGNVVGFAFITDPMKDLYYNSYSLPPFELSWSWRPFIITTVIPFALLMAIAFVGLVRRMGCTPLQFLRHETTSHGVRGGVALPESLRFTTRFGVRVFTRNAGNFVTLFCGIMLASLLLLFGLCLMPTVEHYADALKDDLVAGHLYSLKVPLEIDATDEEREAFAAAEELVFSDPESLGKVEKLKLALKAKDVDEDANYINTVVNTDEAIAQAEKYAVYSLQTLRAMGGEYETVTVYGVQPDSRYWEGLDIGGGNVVMGAGLPVKCGAVVGEERVFVDKFTGDEHVLTPTSVWGTTSNLNLYLAIDDFNELFGNEADYFNGYASDSELALQGRYVANDLTPESMEAMTAQMQDSMGNIMALLLGIAVFVYLILMYLLTKTVIDRSARSISYMKVFGYRDREIDRLYVTPITATVLVSLVASLPIIIGGIAALMRLVFMSYDGNFEVYAPMDRIVVLLVVGALTYAAVACLHVRSIKRVPLALALKAQE